jgi:hypothetical protein
MSLRCHWGSILGLGVGVYFWLALGYNCVSFSEDGVEEGKCSHLLEMFSYVWRISRHLEYAESSDSS